MTLRTLLKILLGLALGLPLVQAMLFWIGRLLSAMGDDEVALLLSRTSIVLGAMWLACLAGLVVVLAVQALEAERTLDE